MEKSRKPKIRFKGFTDDWEQRELGEVAKYRNGKAHENDISEHGEYVVVNSKFVSTDGEVCKFSNKQIEPLYKDEIAFVLSDVPNGRAIARTFLVDKNDKYTLNQRIAGITPAENVCPYFLHILMNRNIYFLQFDDGAKQTNLSITDVMEFEEYYPSNEEQNRIGRYFENLDRLITLHQRKLDKLINVKKSMLEKMFPKQGSTVPEIRFNGFTQAWEQRKLEEILIQRIQHQKITSNVPLLAFSYAEGVIDPNDKKTNKRDFIMTDKYNKIFSKTEKNDIIYNPANVIHGAIHRNKLGIGVVSPIYKIFICQNINPKFLGERLHTDEFIAEIAKYIEGSVIKLRTLSPEQFLDMSIEVPSSRIEQEKIGSMFENLDNLITLHQRKLEKLKNIKKSMLEKMFI